MPNRFSGFRAKLREHGWKHLWRSLNWHTPAWLYGYERTLVLLTDKLLPERRIAPEYSVRLATEKDFAEMVDLGIGKETARQRLIYGDSCMVAEHSGRVVAMYWVATGKLFLKVGGCELDMKDDGFYLYNALTLPEHRRQGLIGAITRTLQDLMAKQGRTKAYNAISAFNDISIVAHERLGFEIVAETVYWQLLGLRCCRYLRWPEPIRRCRRVSKALLARVRQI